MILDVMKGLLICFKFFEFFKDYQFFFVKIVFCFIFCFMIKKFQVCGEVCKGCGFGFVIFVFEEFQQKVVQEMNVKEIEGCEIVVKVVIDSFDKIDEEVNVFQEEINGQEEIFKEVVFVVVFVIIIV